MSGKSLIVGSVVFILILIGLVFLFASGQKPDPKIISYAADSVDKPKVDVAKTFIDIGDMKVDDIKNADFTIKNSGTKPLQIVGITTSCHCTFAQIIYKDLKTPEYGMTTPARYVTDIAPGDTATVRVIYKPFIMPIFGFVEREAYITTNDPTNQKIVLSIKMNVQ